MAVPFAELPRSLSSVWFQYKEQEPASIAKRSRAGILIGGAMRGGHIAYSLLSGSVSSLAHHSEEHLPLGCFTFNKQANLDKTWFA